MFGFAPPLQFSDPGAPARQLADSMNQRVAGALAGRPAAAGGQAAQGPAMGAPAAVKPGGQPVTMNGLQMPNRAFDPMAPVSLDGVSIPNRGYVPDQPTLIDGIQMPGMAANVPAATASAPIGADAAAGGASIFSDLAAMFGG